MLAAPPVTAERRLGTTVASLGDPSQPGFWVKTPLVQSETDGRIVNPANGKSAKVRLIPLGGAGGGSQVSLPALQLIGVSLTDLPLIEGEFDTAPSLQKLAAREAQILGQIRIDDPTAVLRHGRTGRDLRAADDQVILIGRRLSRAEGLEGPVRDIDE